MMKYGIGICTVIVLAGCGAIPVETPTTQTDVQQETVSASLESITPAEFKTAIQAGIGLVLDVRTEKELLAGRIVEEPINIDFYKKSFAQDLERLDRSETYLLYCRSGNRSGDTLTMMKDMGFTRVYELAGGMNAWEVAKYPVIK